MLTRVAILGRPNAGKSTLFNRFCGWRKALVHDEPGVTRDRIEAPGQIGGQQFLVIDTAGLELGDPGSLADRLLEQSLAGLSEADLGLFLVDGRSGLVPLDQEIAGILRRQAKPVILCVNKCEARTVRDTAVAEAWELGLGEPVAISAEHGEGLLDLADRMAPYLAQPEDEVGDESDRPIKISIVGRPNAGKSTLVNALIGDERLLTGPEPGLTRDAITLDLTHAGRAFQIVDTAGLRRRAKVDHRLEQLSGSQSIRAIRMSHIVALVIDATQGIDKQDLTIANLALDEGRGLVLIANKWDALDDAGAALAAINDRLTKSLTQVRGVPLIKLSAKTGRGLKNILPTVLKLHERWSTSLSTSQLNRWLELAVDVTPPPMVQNRRLKFRYVTQTGQRPPTFTFFANKPAKAIPAHYLRYLTSSLRERFGLEGVVIRTAIKHGANPYDPKAGDR